MIDWISSLAQQPLVLAALLLVAVLMVYGILKRLFKLALLMALTAVAIVLWFHFTGREMPGNLDDMARKAGKAASTDVAIRLLSDYWRTAIPKNIPASIAGTNQL